MSTNTHTSDAQIQQSVKRMLDQLGRRRLRLLDVDVQSGVACLRGRVKNFHERQLAINACQRVDGVHEMVDEIEVEGPIVQIN